MTYTQKLKSGLALAAVVAAGTFVTLAVPNAANAQAATKSGRTIVLSIGEGQQVNLPTPVTDVFVANPGIADVDVKSSKQIYLVGKGPGETTVYATDAAGHTVYQATLRVGNNIGSLDQMLLLAMPEANIKSTTLNGTVLLTGTVKQPEDAAEAERLVKAFVGEGTQVISRLRTATPLQVNLQVRIAEVSRSLAKEISGNLKTQDNGESGGILGGAYHGRDIADITPGVNVTGFPLLDPSTSFGLPAGTLPNLPFNPGTGKFIAPAELGTKFLFKIPAGTNVLAAAGKLFGLNVAAAFDLSEKAGLISTLANPNLTTVSGETADFLVGGSFPLATSSNNGTSIDYKNYGISLTYTPIVLSDGRISLRVRTEVSDISSQGAIRIGGLEIPATTNRMAETTVELGSGQSMMIAGLLKNELGSSVDKVPGVGDVPVLGALFKSNGWRRNETELMIVITPYLVKPVSDSEIKLPTDGIHSPNDAERVLMGKMTSDKGEKTRPMPTVAPTAPQGPDFGSVSDTTPTVPKAVKPSKAQASAAAPGFSF
jgi:pilus assembly protein CpaC